MCPLCGEEDTQKGVRLAAWHGVSHMVIAAVDRMAEQELEGQ